MERAGLATGLKHFGTHDWYKEGASILLKLQAPDGHWFDSKLNRKEPVSRLDSTWAETLDTAYCLLFLARGRLPIVMAKLRFDGVTDHHLER